MVMTYIQMLVTSLVVPQDLATMMLKYIHTLAQFSLLLESSCCMEGIFYEVLDLHITIWSISEVLLGIYLQLLHRIIISRIHLKVRRFYILFLLNLTT